MKILQLAVFRKEMFEFPQESQDEIWFLVERYVRGERLPKTLFKTFSIDKKTKIQEFKVKDHRGNWRAIASMCKKERLVFVYAFHKKTEHLEEKDKRMIRKRIQRIPYEV